MLFNSSRQSSGQNYSSSCDILLIFYDLKTCLRNIAEEPVEAVADLPEPVAAEPPAAAGEEEPDGQG